MCCALAAFHSNRDSLGKGTVATPWRCTELGIEIAKGVHVGIHCFRHGVTSELLESGTPIHVVTRLMRHADSKVTVDYFAHIVGDRERFASERLSQIIGQNITHWSQTPNWSQLPLLRPRK
jgi:integrase